MEPVVYQEGLLLKRQRGLHSSSTKKLKFQERFCRLTSTSLDYYDPNVKRKVSYKSAALRHSADAKRGLFVLCREIALHTVTRYQ